MPGCCTLESETVVVVSKQPVTGSLLDHKMLVHGHQVNMKI